MLSVKKGTELEHAYVYQNTLEILTKVVDPNVLLIRIVHRIKLA